MNLKSIRKYFKNATLAAIAVIVLAGTTGLSYKAHYCHERLSGIAFFTELGLQKPATCGCKDDKQTAKATSGEKLPLSFHQRSCCTNISFFNKLNVETTSSVSLKSVTPAVAAIFTSFINILPAGRETIPTVLTTRQRYKPLSGRRLVLLLSQQRLAPIHNNC